MSARPKLQLAGSTVWRIDGDTLFLYNDRVLRIDNCGPGIHHLLPLLEEGASLDELHLVWGGDAAGLDDLLNLLTKLRIVVPAVEAAWAGTNVERQVRWFSALGIDGNMAQHRLAQGHVAIWGLGGIGSVVLQQLAGAGIRAFTLIDFDVVARHNLNRQFIYTDDQIGMPKTDAALHWLRAFAPHAEINATAVQRKIESVEELRAARTGARWDILVVAADEPAGRVGEIAAAFCEADGVAVIGGSCGFDTGGWGPLLRPDMASNRPERAADAETERPAPALAPMPASFGPTNGLIGCLLARDVIAFLAGFDVMSDGQLLTVDFRTLALTATEMFQPVRS